jgi:uncharacterized membrane protein YqjE
MGEPAKEARLFASIRRLSATVLELAQVRIDLLSTELELEKRRIFDGLLWGALAIVVLSLGLVLTCGYIILLFWDTYRLTAAGLLAGFFLGIGFLLVTEARRRLRNLDGMFRLSLNELEQDMTDLRSADDHEQR